jgi:hypothetical protein
VKTDQIIRLELELNGKDDRKILPVVFAFQLFKSLEPGFLAQKVEVALTRS